MRLSVRASGRATCSSQFSVTVCCTYFPICEGYPLLHAILHWVSLVVLKKSLSSRFSLCGHVLCDPSDVSGHLRMQKMKNNAIVGNVRSADNDISSPSAIDPGRLHMVLVVFGRPWLCTDSSRLFTMALVVGGWPVSARRPVWSST